MYCEPTKNCAWDIHLHSSDKKRVRRRHVATFTALEALACISCFSSPTPQRRDWRCAAFCWRWFMSTQSSASRSDSRRSVTRQGVDDGGSSTARQQMEIARNLTICGGRCLSCRGEMFFRTTNVRRLCLLKGIGRLSSVRYRLLCWRPAVVPS